VGEIMIYKLILYVGFGQSVEIFDQENYASHALIHVLTSSLTVRAAEEPKGGDDIRREGGGYGLGGKEAFFGFGRFQELQVGRLAMVGFAVISPPCPIYHCPSC
jgi:hypothetical protein